MEFELKQTDQDQFTLTVEGDASIIPFGRAMFPMNTVEAVELFAAVDHCIGDYAARIRERV